MATGHVIPQADPDLARALGLHGSRRWQPWLGRLFLFLLLAGLAAGGLYYRKILKERAAPTYVTAAVERGDLKVSVTATGTMEPANTVEVGAEVSGRLVSVKADFNSLVKKGQLLAEIDPEPWRLRVQETRAMHAAALASIAQAEANLLESRQNQERTAELLRHGSATPQQMDSAVTATQRALAALAAARAQAQNVSASLSVAQSQLRKTAIRSPMDGLVLARKVEPGQTVVSAFQAPVLFVLAQDLEHMTLHVNVDEADVGRVRAGQSATFTVDAYPGRRFPARLVEVRNAPKTVQNVVTYDTVLSVENADRLLRPGMTATATIETETRRGVLLAPNAALRFAPPVQNPRPMEGRVAPAHRQDKLWVDNGGNLHALTVVAGPTDGERTEVSGEGIQEGLVVVTDVARKGP